MASRISQLIDEAKPILVEAISMEQSKHYMNAVNRYTEGSTLLYEAHKLMPESDFRKANLLPTIMSYVERAEKLRKECLKTVENLEQKRIVEDSTGNDYYTVFGRCINDALTSVVIEDAYVHAHHQILNFVRFCEILVQRAKNLKRITLITSEGGNLALFDDLKKSLKERSINLLVSEKQLHDREITFDNGWIIKIGRGLDYFKPPQGKYTLGSCDYAMKRCRETTIDIYKVRRG
ncbi:hypothetical protein QR680_012234 [Steinernema hermaphroditum]|uniref:MIT domain-containing protein n=1 Tax=Steinernema hermaphroditum TaxID=289476 RepID=A0AA39I430_9BILA|nr:hypothetical protein QR680_012234 [Steinernema hermaphroditum]